MLLVRFAPFLSKHSYNSCYNSHTEYITPPTLQKLLPRVAVQWWGPSVSEAGSCQQSHSPLAVGFETAQGGASKLRWNSWRHFSFMQRVCQSQWDAHIFGFMARLLFLFCCHQELLILRMTIRICGCAAWQAGLQTSFFSTQGASSC